MLLAGPIRSKDIDETLACDFVYICVIAQFGTLYNSCYIRVLIFLCARNTSPLLPPLLTPDGNVFEFVNFVSHSASPHSLLIVTQLQCMYIGFLRPLRLDSKIIQHSGSLSMASHRLFPITMAKVCVLDFQHSC